VDQRVAVVWVRCHALLAVGTDRILMALIEDPEWCFDMSTTFSTSTSLSSNRIWDAGYHFDTLPGRMIWATKSTSSSRFNTYREILKPVHSAR